MITKAIRDVLMDPSAHDSLKAAIHIFADRDPVDAANDAGFLAELLMERLHEVTRARL